MLSNSTMTQRLLLRPAQVVAGQQEAQREAPAGGPSNAAVTAPQAPQGADVQAAVLHHCYRQKAAPCAHMHTRGQTVVQSKEAECSAPVGFETHLHCISPWQQQQDQTA